MTTTEEKILELVKAENPDNPTEYVSAIVRGYSRKKLDDLIRSCKDCPAKNNIKSVTWGSDKASVMIINEGIYEPQLAYGSKEIRPLEHSPEMKYIDTIIDAYHINRKHLFYMNAVNCCTYVCVDGKIIDRPPNTHEIECCRGYVENMIDIMHPVLIILLGNIPFNMFHKGESIMKGHGKWINVHGVQAMPVYSPHFLVSMREDESNDQDLVTEYECEFGDDLKVAFDWVKDNFDGDIILDK